MADWSEDEWDSSSPIGSPSSALPQSIRDVLESVRAECDAGMFGSFYSTSVEDQSNNAREEEVTSREEWTSEKEAVKGTATERNSQIEVNFDASEDFPRTKPLTPSQVITQQKIANDLPEGPNPEAQKDFVTSSRVNAVEEEEITTNDGGAQAENTQSQEGLATRFKTTCERNGLQGGIRTQQENILYRDKINLNEIIAGYQKANAGRWIKIDTTAKKPSLQNVDSITDSRLKMANESGRLPNSSPKRAGSVRILGLRTRRKGHEERTKRDDFKRRASTENDPPMRMDIPHAHGTVTRLVNSNQGISGKQHNLTDPLPEKQTVHHTDLTDSPDWPVSFEGSMERRNVYKSLETHSRPDIVVNEPRATKNVMLIEKKAKSSECTPAQKYFLLLQPKEVINLREGENKASGDTGYSDLMEDPESSKPKIGVDERDAQGTYELSGKEHGASALNKEGPATVLGCGQAEVQSKMELESTDYELQTISETLKQDEPTKSETLHEGLKGKYFNMHDSEDSSVEKYPDLKPGYYEEMEEFARTCDDSHVTGFESVKLEIFSDDESQATNRNEICGNTSVGKTAEFDEESRENSLLIWRRELLSSDFSLIYGSLRAVLMRNISKDERHRLVQTMIATTSEIEDVILGEGTPVQHSLRCGTPDVSGDCEEVECNVEESADEMEEPEIKPEVSDEKLLPRINVSLREREIILNRKRVNKLMIKCFDGLMKCLVCKKTGQPNHRVCVACSTFAYRVERNYTIGIPIPTCYHNNYSGTPRCKSCRFRKFNFMSNAETETRARLVRAKDCPVCKKTSLHFRGWKCYKCYNFLLRNLRKEDPVYCVHTGEYPNECDGCRFYNFQKEWAKREPRRPYPLPLLKKPLIKCET